MPRDELEDAEVPTWQEDSNVEEEAQFFEQPRQCAPLPAPSSNGSNKSSGQHQDPQGVMLPPTAAAAAVGHMMSHHTTQVLQPERLSPPPQSAGAPLVASAASSPVVALRHPQSTSLTFIDPLSLTKQLFHTPSSSSSRGGTLFTNGLANHPSSSNLHHHHGPPPPPQQRPPTDPFHTMLHLASSSSRSAPSAPTSIVASNISGPHTTAPPPPPLQQQQPLTFIKHPSTVPKPLPYVTLPSADTTTAASRGASSCSAFSGSSAAGPSESRASSYEQYDTEGGVRCESRSTSSGSTAASYFSRQRKSQGRGFENDVYAL